MTQQNIEMAAMSDEEKQAAAEAEAAFLQDIFMRLSSGRHLGVLLSALFGTVQSIALSLDQENKAFIVGNMDKLAKLIIHSPDVSNEVKTH